MAELYNRIDEITLADSCLCFLKPKSKVLEFGSATGYATRYMSEKLNCEVTCIEINPEMAKLAEPYAKNVIIGDIEGNTWENKLTDTFDYILFADVLEHLRRPETIIYRAKQFLAENGFILTSIPNIGHNSILLSLRNGKFEYTSTGLLDDTHIHFLTRESIFKIFNKNDLFCTAEENKLIRPCDTELGNYYCQYPLMAISLISKVDGHVYRFVHQWSKSTTTNNSDFIKGKKLTITQRFFELVYDFGCFIKRKFNLKTPGIMETLVFQPAEKTEKKKYEKYTPKS